MKECTVYKKRCTLHGFIHGGEAEELRQRMEELAVELEEADPWPIEPVNTEEIAKSIRKILEEVDARDSVAFLEAEAHDEDDEEESETTKAPAKADSKKRTEPRKVPRRTKIR